LLKYFKWGSSKNKLKIKNLYTTTKILNNIKDNINIFKYFLKNKNKNNNKIKNKIKIRIGSQVLL